MACGCSGSKTGCSCSFSAGDHVTITGVGSPGNPFVISSDGGGGPDIWINVKGAPYNAVGNGIADDTAAIQAALTAAAGMAATASATVYVPPGFYVVAPLMIPHGVVLRGSGNRATTLILKASTTTGSTMLKNAQFATMVSVMDMRLDGNYASQGAAVINGLIFDGSGSGGGAGNLEYLDERAQAHNVVIQNFTGDALTLTGRGACQVNSVQAWNNKGHGFSIGIDSEVVNCDAGSNGKDGFYITGNPQLTNCKSWFSGWWNGAQQTANFTGGAVFGNGFHWEGSSAGAASANLYAQDNARVGLYLNGSDRVSVAGFVSDSNNNNTAAGPTLFSNVEINNTYDSIVIGGVSFDRVANPRRPRWGGTIGGGSSNIVLEYVTQGFTNSDADALDPASATYGNTLRIGNSAGSTGQSFALNFTPDNVAGGLISIDPLTANMTVAAPLVRNSDPLTLSFVQDGTGGRTLTWNGAYDTTWQPAAAASAKSAITFRWDSNNGKWLVIATAKPAGSP